MFGVYGNLDVYLIDFFNVINIDDILKVKEVIIMKNSRNKDNGKLFWKGIEYVVLFRNVGNEDNLSEDDKSLGREIN